MKRLRFATDPSKIAFQRRVFSGEVQKLEHLESPPWTAPKSKTWARGASANKSRPNTDKSRPSAERFLPCRDVLTDLAGSGAAPRKPTPLARARLPENRNQSPPRHRDLELAVCKHPAW